MHLFWKPVSSAPYSVHIRYCIKDVHSSDNDQSPTFQKWNMDTVTSRKIYLFSNWQVGFTASLQQSVLRNRLFTFRSLVERVTEVTKYSL